MNDLASHNASRPPLVLIGGWAYPVACLRPLAADLAEAFDVRLLTFDTADHIVVEAARDPRTIMAGWSLGGLRVLELVATGRLKPRGLVLLAPTSRFCADEGYPSGTPRPLLRSMMSGIAKSREKTLSTFFALAMKPDATDPDTIRSRIDAAATLPTEDLRHGLDLLDRIDVRHLLPRITCPTLLLHGALDRIINPDAGRWVADHLPSSVMAVIPGAGHELPLRHAAWTAEHIRTWHARTPPEAA